MAEVQAVKDRETVTLIGHLLMLRFGQQMADVWNTGINLALRVSDLLSITFDQIADDRLLLKESKTGKIASIKLNSKAKHIIERIRSTNPYHTYLFQSFRSTQARQGSPKPITRRAVSKAFESIGREVNVSLGTHSMRKTRGYHLYKATNDIARVMKMLRHNSEGVTLRYIGITQEDIDKDFCELEL